MSKATTYSISVGELAYALRLPLAAVKSAAHAKSAFVRLGSVQLDETLQTIKEMQEFHSGGWDLHELDACSDESASSLRRLYSTPVAFPASLPPSQGLQIRELIRQEEPQKVLEVGCFIGISSHWIAGALGEDAILHIDSVDTFWPKPPNPFHYSYLEDPYRLATSVAQETAVGRRIRFHVADSITYASSLPADRMYDFMFIDGDHTFAGVTSDVLAFFRHLKPGGAILLHDIHPKHCGWLGPRQLIDRHLLTSHRVSVTEIDTTPNFGMALIRKLRDDKLPFDVPQRLVTQLAFERARRRLVERMKANNFWFTCAAKSTLAGLRHRRATRRQQQASE